MRPGYAHFNYDLIDGTCKCTLCNDVRKAREEMDVTATRRIGQTYGSSSKENMAWRAAISRHAAASNRREIYSEICFLLTWEKMPWRDQCLDWLYDIAFRRAFAVDYWWVQCGEERPLGIWVEEWWEATQGTRMSYTRIFDIGSSLIKIIDAHLDASALPGRRGLFARYLLSVWNRPDIKDLIPGIAKIVQETPEAKLARAVLKEI